MGKVVKLLAVGALLGGLMAPPLRAGAEPKPTLTHIVSTTSPEASSWDEEGYSVPSGGAGTFRYLKWNKKKKKWVVKRKVDSVVGSNGMWTGDGWRKISEGGKCKLVARYHGDVGYLGSKHAKLINCKTGEAR